jgi:hypothetical protein
MSRLTSHDDCYHHTSSATNASGLHSFPRYRPVTKNVLDGRREARGQRVLPFAHEVPTQG